MAQQLDRLRKWRKAKVRGIGAHSYVRFTPTFGFGIALGRYRIRYARHHGLQLLRWNGRAWDKRWPKTLSKVEQQIAANKRAVHISAGPPGMSRRK